MEKRVKPPCQGSRDYVQLGWKIRGQSSVLFSQRMIAQPPGDSIRILEFKLIAHKGKIDSFRTIQVPVKIYAPLEGFMVNLAVKARIL